MTNGILEATDTDVSHWLGSCIVWGLLESHMRGVVSEPAPSLNSFREFTHTDE